MKNASKLTVWLKQTRANFLFLALFLNAIGIGLAYKYIPAGIHLQLTDIVLIILGTVAAHVSVNLFNEYSDYRTGIDFHTNRTPFNGGSGMMVQGLTSPPAVLGAAIGTLLFAMAIGIYYAFTSHWLLLLIITIGAASRRAGRHDRVLASGRPCSHRTLWRCPSHPFEGKINISCHIFMTQ